MKAETFIHYYSRLKNKLRRSLEKLSNTIYNTKQFVFDCLGTTTYYYSEICIQSKNFKNNFKYINRF